MGVWMECSVDGGRVYIRLDVSVVGWWLVGCMDGCVVGWW